MSSTFDLSGKVAVVVGASSGLGADAARAYAEHGADVALLARRLDRLEALKAEIEAAGHHAVAVRCDVTDEDSCRAAVDAVIDAYGRIDILLNNAGVAVRGGVDTLTDTDWDRSFDTNVKGIFHVSKYVVPRMRERGYGKIVNIASVNAVVADKHDVFIRHAYNASKAAVLGADPGNGLLLRPLRHYRQRHWPGPVRVRDDRGHPVQERGVPVRLQRPQPHGSPRRAWGAQRDDPLPVLRRLQLRPGTVHPRRRRGDARVRPPAPWWRS